MAELVTLSCPTCGGKLTFEPWSLRCLCPFCGNEHLVTLEPYGYVLREPFGRLSADLRFASEGLVLPRMEKEIETHEDLLPRLEARRKEAVNKQKLEVQKASFGFLGIGGLLLVLIGVLIEVWSLWGVRNPDAWAFFCGLAGGPGHSLFWCKGDPSAHAFAFILGAVGLGVLVFSIARQRNKPSKIESLRMLEKEWQDGIDAARSYLAQLKREYSDALSMY